MHRTLLILVLLTYSATIGIVRAQSQSHIRDELYERTVSIHPSLSKYTFRLCINDSNVTGCDHAVSRIEVMRARDKRILQTLGGFEMVLPFRPEMFKIVDLNFDGYQDIMLDYAQGSGGSSSHVWLCDPRTGMFRYNRDLSMMSTPYPDTTSKTLISEYWSGVGESGYDEYCFKHGKLVLVSTMVKRYDEQIKLFIRTITEFNGKKVLRTVVDTLMNE